MVDDASIVHLVVDDASIHNNAYMYSEFLNIKIYLRVANLSGDFHCVVSETAISYEMK